MIFAIVAALWTLICMVGVSVWGGIVADSAYYWLRLGEEDAANGRVYFQVLLGHLTVFSVLALWTAIGTIALLRPGDRGIAVIIELVGLFAGPLGLTALGLWVAWSRRRRRP